MCSVKCLVCSVKCAEDSVKIIKNYAYLTNPSIYKLSSNLGASVLVSPTTLMWIVQLGQGPGDHHLREILCNLYILVGFQHLPNSDQPSLFVVQIFAIHFKHLLLSQPFNIFLQVSLGTGVVLHHIFFFTFLWRSFLILHAEGFVKDGRPNLALFSQLFWILLTSFFSMSWGLFILQGC